jgi:hypothetical protein
MDIQRIAEIGREICQIIRETETYLHSPCVEFDEAKVGRLRKEQSELEAILRGGRPDAPYNHPWP